MNLSIDLMESYPILVRELKPGWQAVCHTTGVRCWSLSRRVATIKVIKANNKIQNALMKSGYIPPYSSCFEFHSSKLLYEGVDLEIFDAIFEFI